MKIYKSSRTTCIRGLKIALIILSSLYLLLNIAHAETVNTKLSRDQISLGETVTITFNLNSAFNKSPDFSALEKDFRVLGTNYSTAINIINGSMQTQTLWQVTVEPKIAGELWIPAINFGGNKSTPLKVSVKKGTEIAQNDQPDSSVFIKAELNTTSPYVQSQVIYTFKLFYNTQLENPSIEPPRIEDANPTSPGGNAFAGLEQLGEDKLYQTTINGKRFLVFEKNFVMFPQRAGKLIIPSTQFRALKMEYNPTSMNNPFYITKPKLISLTSESFVLNVQKIPNSFEGKTWLPAKNISLTEKWTADPSQLETGIPITRTIQIEAQGLRADQIPDLPVEQISGVNIYTDPPRRRNNLQGTVVVGTLKQKITYIPNQSERFTIPAMSINWWNTQTNTNAIAELKSIPVQVQPKMNNIKSVPTQTIPSVIRTDSANKSLVPAQKIKISTNETNPFYLSIWFWVSICLLTMWFITLWWVWKNKVAKTSNSNSTETIDHADDLETFSTKSFQQVCKQGDFIQAQKLILSWAKTQWEHPPHNLGKLCEMIDDENFKNTLKNLELALYANGMIQWKGDDLFTAYQQACKHLIFRKHKNKMLSKNQSDPLPPLHP